jgi:hypothetical protein
MKFIKWINRIIDDREKSVPVEDILETILRSKLSYRLDGNTLFVLDRTDADPAGLRSNVEFCLNTLEYGSKYIRRVAFYKINRKGNVLVWNSLCGYHVFTTRKITRVLSVYQKSEVIVPPEKIIRLDAPPWYPIQGYDFEDTVADTTCPMFVSEAINSLDKYVASQLLRINTL